MSVGVSRRLEIFGDRVVGVGWMTFGVGLRKVSHHWVDDDPVV